ncbi:MAG: ABC transporter permease [Thermoleophilaceae bacterium]
MTTAALAWRQFRFERRLFWRNPSAAFFNFLLPLVLLVLIAAAFGTSRARLDTLIPGIAGMSVMTTTFIALAYNVTFLREQGILKRMRGTPLPKLAYFGGLIGNAVANALVQVVIIVVLARAVYGLGWPRDPAELIVFTLLGVTAFAALGVAYAHVIPTFTAAAAYVNIVFLPVILISGTFYSVKSLPGVLDALARILPLKHVIDGFSGAIVTGRGLGDNLGAVAVIAVWALVGIVLAVRKFRWEQV